MIDKLKHKLHEAVKNGIISDDKFKMYIDSLPGLSKNKLEQLNTFLTITSFYYSIKDYDYGFYGIDNHRYVYPDTEIDGIFQKYRTMNSETVHKHKCYVCWDATRLEAEWFKKNLPDIPVKCYYCEYAPPNCESHTWLTFKLGNNWYIFEASWKPKTGIHRLDSTSPNVWIPRYIKDIPQSHGSGHYAVFEYDPLSEKTGLTTEEFMNNKWSCNKYNLPTTTISKMILTNIPHIKTLKSIYKFK